MHPFANSIAMPRPKNWIDVDAWMAEQSLASAAEACGVRSLEITGNGSNQRIDCPFGCEGDHAGKREIAVDCDNPAKQWKCHAYECECRGNLLNLMHGWLNGNRWTGDKLRGAEFNQIKQVIAGEKPAETPPPRSATTPAEAKREPKENLPLVADEKTRSLMDPPLWEKLVTDVAAMSPAASAYVRRRCSLSSAAMQKWHVGILPTDGGGDKRGWSLRNQVVYPFTSEDNEVIAFVARDPQFEDKLQAFEATSPEQRDASKRPHKYRFPKGFHRGIELFGQERQRLEENVYREAIHRLGLIIVEGFNDVIALDALEVPAFGICSNLMTDEQVAKIVRLAKELSDGKVRLLFDCDAEGDEGAKEAAWKLLQAGLDVRPLWSRSMHGGKFAGRQPESLKPGEWSSIVALATTARDDRDTA